MAFHVHTTWSFDGTWSLERTAAALRKRGYDAALTCEHAQSLDEGTWARYKSACWAISRLSGVLLVPGVEYRDPSNTIHVPVWGDVPFFGDGLGVGELLKVVSEKGGIAILAHPGRRDAHKHFEPDWAPMLNGVEIWNRKYDGWAPNADALAMATRWNLPMFAALDFHGRRQFFPLKMILDWSWPPSKDAVLSGMRDRSMRPRFIRTPPALWAGTGFSGILATAERGRRWVAPLLRARPRAVQPARSNPRA